MRYIREETQRESASLIFSYLTKLESIALIDMM